MAINPLALGGSLGAIALLGLGAGLYFVNEARETHKLFGDRVLAATREATHDGALDRDGAAGAIRLLGSRADNVVTALQTATGSKDVKLSNAADQIKALGENYSTVRTELNNNNQRLSAMAADLARRKADAAEWQRLLFLANAEKRELLKILSDGEIKPSVRQACEDRILEAERAMDAARKAGAQ